MQLSHFASQLWISTVLLTFGHTAFAQSAPSAGSQLLQILPVPVRQPQKPDMQVELDNRPSSADTDSSKVVVKELQITGANSIAAEELIRASGFVPGNQFNLAELRTLASKITSRYRSLGYFLAQTYLPAQDVTDGIVRLSVIEGQFGQIKVQNRSTLSDGVANCLLDGLKGTDAVTTAVLERRILILSDLPGINVKSVLRPGTSTGYTDLLVDITPGQRVSGGMEADNQGNRYTGANRVGASININELIGLGDVAAARVLTSGEGLAYARASYQVQAWKVNFGLAFTVMRYQLGGEFASTQSSGTARIGSVYASYPLIRARKGNLNAQWSFDNKEFADRAGSGTLGSSSDKSSQVGTVSLRGDVKDSVGNGLNNYLLSWTRGNISLQNSVVQAIDAISAHSSGTFDKVVYGLTRQQDMTTDTGLYVSLYGQLASKNFDASEKISLGGAGGVRAFPSGEATGDEGILMTVETRTRLSGLSEALTGQVQLIGFVDVGEVSLNKNPWDFASYSNRRRLSGAGLGLNFISTSNLMIKASWAFKLGNESATSAPDSAGRFWLQVNKIF